MLKNRQWRSGFSIEPPRESHGGSIETGCMPDLENLEIRLSDLENLEYPPFSRVKPGKP